MMDGISRRVRDALHAHGHGITQEELARAICLPPDAISRSLSGQRRLKAGELASIATARSTAS